MIVGERKPFAEIEEMVKGYKKLMVLGCGTCVAVCHAGGEKEVELLVSQLRMASRMQGEDVKIIEATAQRQCDREYVEPITEQARECDAILSMACGAGVQFVAEILEPMTVMPALNTRFIGVNLGEGQWSERCRACGNCRLADYGGICPITMCAKSLINGPCGGYKDGKCETSTERDCAWIMIYNRLSKQDKLDVMCDISSNKDYSAQGHPAKYTAEAYIQAELSETED
jgi:ferredoxin